MELRHLRYFVALAEELHFGRAAKRVALTQPPLSQAIRNLETELGVRLFDRTRRRVALTHAGAAFLEDARLTLARATAAMDRAQRAARGEVEVALLRPPVADAELASVVILEEPFVLALPATHRLCALARVPARRLANEPLVMYPRHPGLVFHDIVKGFCLQRGFAPRVAQEASQTHAVIGLVSAGLGVAFVPASAQKIGLAGVEYRPLADRTPLARTAVVWRRADASPVVAAFVDVARRAAKQLHSRRQTTRRSQ